MPRLSKKQRKEVEQAVKEAREKPKRKKKVSIKKASAGTRIPDNVWLDDEQQGYVFIIDGMVLWLDINKETGIIKTMRTPYKEWKNDTSESVEKNTKIGKNKESKRGVVSTEKKETGKVPRSTNSNKL